MTLPQLTERLERDIRNQVLLDRMRTVTLKDRLMLHLRDHETAYIRTAAVAFLLAAWALFFAAVSAARADEPAKFTCPVPGEKCKVLFLNESEEAALMKQNGILDTAAQARNLDLGGVAVYFKTKIGAAQQGEVLPAPKPEPAK